MTEMFPGVSTGLMYAKKSCLSVFSTSGTYLRYLQTDAIQRPEDKGGTEGFACHIHSPEQVPAALLASQDVNRHTESVANRP